MKRRPEKAQKAFPKKINCFLATLLAAALIMSLCACSGSASETVTAQRESSPDALAAANEAAALTLQQYIYARLETEKFITADFSSMQAEEISTMVDELTALWQTSGQLTASAEKIADQALLILEAPETSPAAEQTASKAGVSLKASSLVASGGDYKVVQTAGQTEVKDPKKWAEDLTAKYDAIKGGQTIKQLAQQLGTDAKSAYQQLVLAQDIIRNGAMADADFYDKLTKAAQATKTACKVGVFVTATIATGGGTLSALAGSSMTLAQSGAIIVGGVDCIVDVAATGSSIVLGDKHQLTIDANSVKDKLAPVSAVVGLMTLNTAEAGEKIAYIGDSLTDWFNDGKILGIQVTGGSSGAQVSATQTDTSKVTESDAQSTIEKMGFVPPEKQTSTLDDLIGDYKITSEDVIGTVNNIRIQVKDLAKAAGVYICPSLDELSGICSSGSMTITDVYVSEELKNAEAQPSSDSEGEEGCDIAALPMIEAMEGQTIPMTITITKTGENTGTILMVSQEGATDVGSIDTPAISFSYNAGEMVFDFASADGGIVTGSITAEYDSNNNVVILGSLRVSSTQYGDSFYIDMIVQGSKALAS
jgi:hypothetical protein